MPQISSKQCTYKTLFLTHHLRLADNHVTNVEVYKHCLTTVMVGVCIIEIGWESFNQTMVGVGVPMATQSNVMEERGRTFKLPMGGVRRMGGEVPSAVDDIIAHT